MNDLLKGWLVPRPVFAPDDDAGAAVVDKVDAADAGADAGDKDDTAAADAVVTDEKAGDVVAADAGDKAGDVADDKGGALPDNWREIAADGDEDLLKELKRYGSIKGVVKALKESKDTIRSGKLKRDMPDPTDEKAMAEWRKAEGIPDDPSGYELSPEVTKRLVDEDKPVVASFTEFAHKKGLPVSAVNAGVEWYTEMVEAMEAERIGKDKSASETAEEALRRDWGKEYKANLTLATQYVEGIPGVGKAWTEARLSDGRRLGDIPEFVEWASDMGRVEFGDPAFATSDSVERHNSRKAEIEGILKTDRGRYFREGLDKEYGEILQKEEKRRK